MQLLTSEIPRQSRFPQNRRRWRGRRKRSWSYQYGGNSSIVWPGTTLLGIGGAFVYLSTKATSHHYLYLSRRRRQREAASNYRKCGARLSRHINSVSYIDRVARIVFPASFGLLNVCYWVVYVTYQEEFKWQDPPIGSITPISR